MSLLQKRRISELPEHLLIAYCLLPIDLRFLRNVISLALLIKALRYSSNYLTGSSIHRPF